ncbi:hypothetical protein PUN28_010854 [Cardiocondyla obscurior]|uniref:Uncharacterized protein n=1 Tax=Cardiocondyla obscurior TaxID=286306 RepID=A0AAW2FK44_9HYME
MRILLSVFLYILVACGKADSQNYQDSFVYGERQEGDYVTSNRTIFKPALPWKPMVARIGVTVSEYEILTYVAIKSLTGNEIQIHIINSTSINLVASVHGKLGEGLYVQLVAYAKYIPTTTKENETTPENNEQDNNNENDSESNAENPPSAEEGDEGNSEPDTVDEDANSAEGDDG